MSKDTEIILDGDYSEDEMDKRTLKKWQERKCSWKGILGAFVILALSCSALSSRKPEGSEGTEKISSFVKVEDVTAVLSNGHVLTDVCPLSSNTVAANEELYGTLQNAANSHDIEVNLLIAVMAAESRCRVRARSHAGALGLMQLMPRTAKWLGVKDPYSPKDNVSGGAKYLAMLLKDFNGDIELTLAAYNSGPATVKRYKSIPPYRETKNYVRRVLGLYEQLQTPVRTEEV